MLPISRDGTAEACCSRPYRRSHLVPLTIEPVCLPPHTHTPALPHAVRHPRTPPPHLFFAPASSEKASGIGSGNGGERAVHVPPQYRSMISGAGAGFVASIVTCPLDVLKTALQASQHGASSQEYEGVRKTAYRIWRQSGVRGFYRGLGPTIGGYLPTWGIYFTVYDLVKDKLGTVAKDSAHPGFDTAILHILAAMTAGGTGTILTNPLWVVKTRFMAQATLPRDAPRYKHTLDAFLTIYRTEGLKAFYKGLIPSLFGLVHVAVQFPLYEKAKSWADTNTGGSPDHASLSPGTILICSAFSKMIASLATYPHEVLRTRLQMVRNHKPVEPPQSSRAGVFIPPRRDLYSPHTGDPPERHAQANGNGNGNGNGDQQSRWRRKGGIIDTALKIKRQDGWRGFYRGLSINLVRTVPNSAVTMLTYELIMRRLA